MDATRHLAAHRPLSYAQSRVPALWHWKHAPRSLITRHTRTGPPERGRQTDREREAGRRGREGLRGKRGKRRCQRMEWEDKEGGRD